MLTTLLTNVDHGNMVSAGRIASRSAAVLNQVEGAGQ